MCGEAYYNYVYATCMCVATFGTCYITILYRQDMMALCNGCPYLDIETPLTCLHYGYIVSSSPCTEVSWSFSVKVTVVF